MVRTSICTSAVNWDPFFFCFFTKESGQMSTIGTYFHFGQLIMGNLKPSAFSQNIQNIKQNRGSSLDTRKSRSSLSRGVSCPYPHGIFWSNPNRPRILKPVAGSGFPTAIIKNRQGKSDELNIQFF